MYCMFHKSLQGHHKELTNKGASFLNFVAKAEFGYSKDKYNKYIGCDKILLTKLTNLKFWT